VLATLSALVSSNKIAFIEEYQTMAYYFGARPQEELAIPDSIVMMVALSIPALRNMVKTLIFITF
jgi:hypothetical protein